MKNGPGPESLGPRKRSSPGTRAGPRLRHRRAGTSQPRSASRPWCSPSTPPPTDRGSRTTPDHVAYARSLATAQVPSCSLARTLGLLNALLRSSCSAGCRAVRARHVVRGAGPRPVPEARGPGVRDGDVRRHLRAGTHGDPPPGSGHRRRRHDDRARTVLRHLDHERTRELPVRPPRRGSRRDPPRARTRAVCSSPAWRSPCDRRLRGSEPPRWADLRRDASLGRLPRQGRSAAAAGELPVVPSAPRSCPSGCTWRAVARLGDWLPNTARLSGRLFLGDRPPTTGALVTYAAGWGSASGRRHRPGLGTAPERGPRSGSCWFHSARPRGIPALPPDWMAQYRSRRRYGRWAPSWWSSPSSM